MGKNYNSQLLEWRDALGSGTRYVGIGYLKLSAISFSSSNPTPRPDAHAQPLGYGLVGDNYDKHVTPRDMRIDHQAKSLHHFHSYGALNRVAISSGLSREPQAAVDSLPVSTFLPSASDCAALKVNYTILAERIIVEDIPYFHHLNGCVTQHIEHKYSQQMQQKSVTVSYF